MEVRPQRLITWKARAPVSIPEEQSHIGVLPPSLERESSRTRGLRFSYAEEFGDLNAG